MHEALQYLQANRVGVHEANVMHTIAHALLMEKGWPLCAVALRSHRR